MSGLWFILVIFLLIAAMGGAGTTLVRLVEGRRKFLLDMRKEEARIAEAKAKELEVQQKRAELEYREALLELERFDRRAGPRLPMPEPAGDPIREEPDGGDPPRDR